MSVPMLACMGALLAIHGLVPGGAMQWRMGALPAYMVQSMIVPMQVCMGARLEMHGSDRACAHAVWNGSASRDILS